MPYNPDIHQRHSSRLRDYDYSSAGAYFVTICTQGRECLFGEVIDGAMVLNDAGRMVEGIWRALPERFPNVATDEFVAMPNHVHGIVLITDAVGALLAAPGPFGEQGAASSVPTLGSIMRAFKSLSAIAVNRLLDRQGCPLWQRNYYERVIRNEGELGAIRDYIRNNPQKWEQDDENPANASA